MDNNKKWEDKLLDFLSGDSFWLMVLITVIIVTAVAGTVSTSKVKPKPHPSERCDEKALTVLVEVESGVFVQYPCPGK